jgi:hypothetical protein
MNTRLYMRYTDDENRVLLASTEPLAVIAVQLKRSVHALTRQRVRLRERRGLMVGPRMRYARWTAAEDAFVLDLALTIEEAAERLQRTVVSVESRRRMLRRKQRASA